MYTANLNSSAPILPRVIENADEANALIDAPDTITVLYVHSEDCVACRTMRPTIERVVTELAGIAEVVSIDALRFGDIWEAFGIASIPAFLAVGSGQAYAELSGIVESRAIVEMALQSRAAILKANGIQQ